ncbi:MAG: hypothetical protein KTR24_18520 [Saprospiraceae bacterium]|nr:hypothetical protein [Saprospiraceae bacterium]
MIYFLLTDRHRYTLDHYLGHRGKAINKHIGVISYGELGRLNSIECSTLIFSDFDRLSEAQLDVVSRIYHTVKEQYPGVKCLNDPARSLLRPELLRKLALEGINQHNAYGTDEDLSAVKYPVFLRHAYRHSGNLSGIIKDARHLVANIRALKLLGYDRNDLLIVEFLETADHHGRYRKYASLILDGKIFPLQLDVDQHWMVKDCLAFRDHEFEEYERELRAFVMEDPFREWCKGVSDLAAVEYGRIDFAMTPKGPEAWEINLNPDFGSGAKSKPDAWHKYVEKYKIAAHDRIQEAYLALDDRPNTRLQLQLDQNDIALLKGDHENPLLRKVHKNFTTRKPLKRKLVEIAFEQLVRLMLAK